MFAKGMGAGAVWAFGRDARHADRFAKVAKADGYVAGTTLPAEVKRVLDKGGFDVVVEAVGSPEALDTCLRSAGAKGRVNIYGVAPASTPFRQEQT
jgi:threonine dehydrogenase-like Zn-dependent dehydrogenase